MLKRANEFAPICQACQAEAHYTRHPPLLPRLPTRRGASQTLSGLANSETVVFKVPPSGPESRLYRHGRSAR
jgi:hypothetical protein